MIEGGVIFALGSDFNPNAYCMSMPLVMNLACINLKAKPKEVLVAATLNSAGIKKNVNIIFFKKIIYYIIYINKIYIKFNLIFNFFFLKKKASMNRSD